MNRELIKNKFRGQQKDTNIWVYGNAIQCAGIWYIYNENENFRTPQDPDFENSFIEIIPETMGQFTEFYDKNGKEVFEGDVVKLPAGNMRVSFSDGAFVLIPPKTNVIYEALGLIEDEYEIIGNIHDNPEL